MLTKIVEFVKSSLGNKIVRKGYAERIYFPEDDAFLDGAMVTVYESGMVNLITSEEEISLHITNIEILWKTLPDPAYNEYEEEQGQENVVSIKRRHSKPPTMPFPPKPKLPTSEPEDDGAA